MALPRRSEDRQPDRQPDHQPDASGADWRTLYEIENPADVEAYVSRHPSLVTLLAQAPAELAAAFEELPRLVLGYEVDPEDDPPSDFLVVEIVTDRDANEAFRRLDRFTQDWWLDAMPRGDAVLVFLPRCA